MMSNARLSVHDIYSNIIHRKYFQKFGIHAFILLLRYLLANILNVFLYRNA